MSRTTKAAKAAKPSPRLAAKVATRAKAEKRAPGDSKALQQRAADNVAKLNARKGKAECVRSAVNARTGNGLVVTTSHDRTIVVTRVDATVNKLTRLGLPIAPLEAYLKTQPKPQARLAHGVDGRTAPHSAKALRDERSAAAPAKAGKAAATGKGDKARTAKADKAKQPSRGGNRTYVLAGRKDESKPDTFRRYMLSTIMKAKDTASAKAAHAKSGKYPTHKLDFNWTAQQGYIKFTD